MDAVQSRQPADAAPRIARLVASRRAEHGLPRDFYHDDALYAHELDRVWRSGWIFAGHTCQLPRPGDFFTRVCERSSAIAPGTAGCQPAPVATGACAITNVLARTGVPDGSRRSQDFSQTLTSSLSRLTPMH